MLNGDPPQEDLQRWRRNLPGSATWCNKVSKQDHLAHYAACSEVADSPLVVSLIFELLGRTKLSPSENNRGPKVGDRSLGSCDGLLLTELVGRGPAVTSAYESSL